MDACIVQAPHTTASASIIKLITQWLTLCDIINLSIPFLQAYQHQYASF